MDGTSTLINLLAGNGGNGLPEGATVGDTLRWDGAAWAPAQLNGLIDENAMPTVFVVGAITTGEWITGAVPAGHKLVHVTIINTRPWPVIFQLGLSEGGSELLLDGTAGEGEWLDVPVNRFMGPTGADLWFGQHDAMFMDEGHIVIIETKLFYAT